MEENRFERFTLLIDGIHKSINKIKVKFVGSLGIKSVHVFWLYQLSRHPEGLTATEIAAASMVNRSLVSREIEALCNDGYITIAEDGRRYFLTDSGNALAGQISDIVLGVQCEVDRDITREELESFYQTLEKLNNGFSTLAESISLAKHNKKEKSGQ